MLSSYTVDWTGRFHGRCDAVVRPGSTEDVAQLVRWCIDERVPLIPQGGNTGLVGGAVPYGESVVVSTSRMTNVGAFDEGDGQITVEAGVTLAALHSAVAASAWEFGVDLAARDTATIGGMIATNAGGIRVLRHGAMRAQVLGIEAVLGTGEIVSHLGGLVKDNTGYDIAGLLCGSEGTLGVVTKARLRLVPRLPDRLVALVAVESVDEALALCRELRTTVEGIDAIEAVVGRGIGVVVSEFGLVAPFIDEPAVTVLVEWAGRGEPPEALGAIIERYPNRAAIDAAGRARLWEYRERQAEAIARVGVPHKLDVTLPSASMATFIDEVGSAVSALSSSARVHLFGHVADGNIHVNVTGFGPDDERPDVAVLELVAAHGGSISAEHGIGRAKAALLHLTRSPAEIATFRAIKRALDPAGILNPGVLLAAPQAH